MAVNLFVSVFIIALLLFFEPPCHLFNSHVRVKMGGNTQSFTGAVSLKMKTFWDNVFKTQINGFTLPSNFFLLHLWSSIYLHKRGKESTMCIKKPETWLLRLHSYFWELNKLICACILTPYYKLKTGNLKEIVEFSTHCQLLELLGIKKL